MGEVVKLPNCPEVSPKFLRAIGRRTKNASYWAQYWSTYWSVVNSLVCEMDPEEVDQRGLGCRVLIIDSIVENQDATPNFSAAIKARGF